MPSDILKRSGLRAPPRVFTETFKYLTTKPDMHQSDSKRWFTTYPYCSLLAQPHLLEYLPLRSCFLPRPCAAGQGVSSSVPLPSPWRANTAKESCDSTQGLLFVTQVELFALWSQSDVDYELQLFLTLHWFWENGKDAWAREVTALFLSRVSISFHGAQYPGDYCLLSPSKRILGQTLMS